MIEVIKPPVATARAA